jgi:flagellar protein FliL
MAEKENVEQNEEKKKSGGNLKTILIIVPIFLLMIASVFIFMNKIIKPKFQYASKISNNEKEEENDDDEKIGEIYLVEDIIVNPKETVGRRYINVSIGLECKDGSAFGELEKGDVKVRDYLITLFSNCIFAELDDAEDKEKLRERIKTDINKLVSKNGIKAVYFTNFVLQ